MLSILWKYFHYSPKRAGSLKEIQLLNLPEIKVIMPSDTRWLGHKQCIRVVKVSSTALVVTIDRIYQNFHAPEALGLYKALSKFTTSAAIYLLDYTLPLVAGWELLSKSSSNKTSLICPWSLRDIVLALAIFDPRNVPVPILPNFPLMERSQLRFYSTTTGRIICSHPEWWRNSKDSCHIPWGAHTMDNFSYFTS